MDNPIRNEVKLTLNNNIFNYIIQGFAISPKFKPDELSLLLQNSDGKWYVYGDKNKTYDVSFVESSNVNEDVENDEFWIQKLKETFNFCIQN